MPLPPVERCAVEALVEQVAHEPACREHAYAARLVVERVELVFPCCFGGQQFCRDVVDALAGLGLGFDFRQVVAEGQGRAFRVAAGGGVGFAQSVDRSGLLTSGSLFEPSRMLPSIDFWKG